MRFNDMIDTVICDDNLEIMPNIPDNGIDAVITDSPYGLEFMGKEWDKFGVSKGRAKRLSGLDNEGTGDKFFDHREGAAKRGRYSEMSVKEKSTFQEFIYQASVEMIRVLKPGGFLLSFGGTRTYHRMACAIEDAGFEIRDMIAWIYGSGFPKSLNISLQFEKKLCIKEEVSPKHYEWFYKSDGIKMLKKPPFRSEHANEWEEFGTALKPALEPITVARKPLSERTVAENVLKWGTGGINIDGCRVGTENMTSGGSIPDIRSNNYENSAGKKRLDTSTEIKQGRFPANLIHDGSDEVVDMFPFSKSGGDPKRFQKSSGGWKNQPYGNQIVTSPVDIGSASRFFYCAKASKAERNAGCEGLEEKDKAAKNFRPNHAIKAEMGKDGNPYGRWGKIKNNHPTVKPIALMNYLIKLVSREEAVILDPFCGSGTTAVACKQLNRRFIGIDISQEYCDIANKRLANIPPRLETFLEVA